MVGKRWWQDLYRRQHEIWPAWSESDGDAASAAAFLNAWLELPAAATVADMGCGVGREAVALAGLGHRCLGVDISLDLLRRARRRARTAGMAARTSWVCGDFRSIGLAEAAFDLVVFWDSTLNIFERNEAAAVLARLSPALRPGGWLLVQQLHRQAWFGVDQELRLDSPAIGPGVTYRRYRFDRASDVLLDEVTHYPDAAADGDPVHLPAQRLHLYGDGELAEMMADAGLVDVAVAGSDGFAWRLPPAAPPQADAKLVCARGRRPPRPAPAS